MKQEQEEDWQPLKCGVRKYWLTVSMATMHTLNGWVLSQYYSNS